MGVAVGVKLRLLQVVSVPMFSPLTEVVYVFTVFITHNILSSQDHNVTCT